MLTSVALVLTQVDLCWYSCIRIDLINLFIIYLFQLYLSSIKQLKNYKTKITWTVKNEWSASKKY